MIKSGLISLCKSRSRWLRITLGDADLVGYSFRHAYAKRAHSEYFYPPEELIKWMGHEIESHRKYGIYYSAQQIDDAYERGLERRRIMIEQMKKKEE